MISLSIKGFKHLRSECKSENKAVRVQVVFTSFLVITSIQRIDRRTFEGGGAF